MQHNMARTQALIAIVEDDRSIVDFLREALEDEGYQTASCLTTEEAYRCIRKEKPDLIILDVHLDGSEGGLAVLDVVRSTPATVDLPVIVCSADTKFLNEQAYMLQLSHCLAIEKPFDLDRFLTTVQQALTPLPQAKRRQDLPAGRPSTTLRATKRIAAPTPGQVADAGAGSAPPIAELQHKDLDTEVAFARTDSLIDLLRASHQLRDQSQLVCASSVLLRSRTAQIIQNLKATVSQVDQQAWLEAMSSPQPRWRWRGRGSPDT